MNKPRIHAFSKADSVAGQGVGSAYLEQVALIEAELSDQFSINARSKFGDFAEINHFHSINPEYRLAMELAKRKGVSVAHVHFIPETVEESLSLPFGTKKIFYRYLLNFYRAADSLVTVNPWFIRKLSNDYGFDENKLTFIPNFVSPKHFYPLKDDDLKLVAKRRQAFGAEPGQFVVLCAGQLQTRKGFFDLIEIAAALEDILFIWAGGYSFGKISNGYQEIKKATANLPKNLKLLGLIERSEMNEYYNAADLFFLPSYEELFPMTLLEAMSTNTPILVRDLEYYDGVLFDFATRIKAARGENDEFINTIKNFSSDADLRIQAIEAAQNGAQRYSPQNVALKWREYYTGLLS